MSSQAALRDSDDEKLMQLTEALGAAATELDIVRAHGMRIEASLCAMLGTKMFEPQYAADMQQIDMMLQQLAGLRDFFATLSRVRGADALLDMSAALQALALHDLKARLRGEAAEAQACGEIELL